LSQKKKDLHISLVQLPAVNTPQFDWAQNRMDKKPQPAPPVYQPEAAAEGIMKAIDTNAREIFVGKSVLQLVFGNMVLPDFLDKKMADDGPSMQQSQDNEPGGRPHNLFDPVPHEASARGRFDSQASDEALLVDGDLARKIIFGGILALVFLLGVLIG
jgi:hypothetical protein